MPKIRILCLYLTCNDMEVKRFNNNILEKLSSSQNTTIVWYHISVEGNGRNKILTTINTNSNFIKSSNPEKYFTEVFKLNKGIKGIIYGGHSGGEYIGSQHNPVLPTSIFADILYKTYCLNSKSVPPLQFIYFESCHMGTLPWITFFEDITKYVIASPNYYDWFSVLELDSLYQLNKGDLEELADLLDEFATSFNSTSALIELGIYDPRVACELYYLFRKYKEYLSIDKHGQIEDEIFDIRRIVLSSQLPDDVINCFLNSIDDVILHWTRCEKCANNVKSSHLGITLLEYKKN